MPSISVLNRDNNLSIAEAHNIKSTHSQRSSHRASDLIVPSPPILHEAIFNQGIETLNEQEASALGDQLAMEDHATTKGEVLDTLKANLVPLSSSVVGTLSGYFLNDEKLLDGLEAELDSLASSALESSKLVNMMKRGQKTIL